MRLTTRLRAISAAVGATRLDTHVTQLRVERPRILKYLVVGTVGFLVDAGLLALQVHILGIGPLVARGPSFLCAVTVTWWLNRNYTFGGLGRYATATEYRRYFFIQVIGALTNLAVYAAAIISVVWFAKNPVAALALGSVFGLVVNYGLARLFVFPGARQ